MTKNKRYKFTEQEDYIILHSFKLMIDDWESISEQLPGRTPKQIRDRYVNYLKEGLKNEPWTNEEDEILIKLFKEIGPKWSKMMPELPGRSSNDIKNRWHKKLYKRFLQYDISEPQYLSNPDINQTNLNLNNNTNIINPVNTQINTENSTKKVKNTRKPRNSSRKKTQKDISVKSIINVNEPAPTKATQQEENPIKQQEDPIQQIINYEMSIINDTNQQIEQLNQTEKENQAQSTPTLFNIDINIDPAPLSSNINSEENNTNNSIDNMNDFIHSPFHDDFNFAQIIEDLNSQNLDFSWI